MIPELRELNRATFVRIKRDKDAIVRSLGRRKVAESPQLFPRRCSAGIRVYNRQYAEGLVDVYEDELDDRAEDIACTLSYEAIMGEETRDEQLGSLSSALNIGKINYRQEFFEQRS